MHPTKENSVKFSVAVHSYNSDNVLSETLDSILGQTLQPWEIIFVDDGSTDDTEKIIRKNYPDVLYTKIENVGCGAARKHAVELCSMDWVALCDSDDIWLPTHLEWKSTLINTYPESTYTFSNFDSFGNHAKPSYTRLAEAPDGWLTRNTKSRRDNYFLLDDAYLAFLEFNPAFLSGVAFRNDVYYEIGGINPRYSRSNAEDTDFTRRFILHPKSLVAGDSRISWRYRRHGNNMSTSQHKNIFGKTVILENHLNEGIIPSKYYQQVQYDIMKNRLRALSHAYQAKDYENVINYYRSLPKGTNDLKSALKYWLARIMANAHL